MDKLIRRIRARIRLWKARRFLENHRCMSWHQYRHWYDKGFDSRFDAVKNIYHGYTFVHAFPALESLRPTVDKFNEDLRYWCFLNCKGRYRSDGLRVSKRVLWHNSVDDTMEASTDGEWITDELGGGDVLFVAFTDRRDYINFLLRWT